MVHRYIILYQTLEDVVRSCVIHFDGKGLRYVNSDADLEYRYVVSRK